jgi:hypothetical protein
MLVISKGTMLQSRRMRIRFLMRLLDCINLSNPSSRTMILRLTKLLTEISTTDLPWRQSAAGA